MKQQQFVAMHETRWELLETWLDSEAHGKQRPSRKSRGKSPDPSPPDIDFPHLYREVCHHLALARSRMYSQQLIERLGHIVLRAHQRLYRSRSNLRSQIMHFAVAGFPALIRSEWRLVALSALLFLGSMIGMIVTLQFQPDLVYTVMDSEDVRLYETMYNPELQDRFGRESESESDILMFGFYIRNNTSIGFQTFAGGLLYGLGTIFYLLFNGIVIGATAGHLTAVGYTTTFWSFVAGHSALELMAIVFSGAAGLRLGLALIRPGRLSRVRALRESARVSVRIIYGAAIMFLLAAFVEAFWSSIAWIAPLTKYGVGIGFWVLLGAYILLPGRRHAA